VGATTCCWSAGNKSGRPGGFLTNFSRLFFLSFPGALSSCRAVLCAWLVGSPPLVCGLDVWEGSVCAASYSGSQVDAAAESAVATSS
jgi:hypothetical protein